MQNGTDGKKKTWTNKTGRNGSDRTEWVPRGITPRNRLGREGTGVDKTEWNARNWRRRKLDRSAGIRSGKQGQKISHLPRSIDSGRRKADEEPSRRQTNAED